MIQVQIFESVSVIPVLHIQQQQQCPVCSTCLSKCTPASAPKLSWLESYCCWHAQGLEDGVQTAHEQMHVCRTVETGNLTQHTVSDYARFQIPSRKRQCSGNQGVTSSSVASSTIKKGLLGSCAHKLGVGISEALLYLMPWAWTESV